MELSDYQLQAENYQQYKKGLGPYSTLLGMNSVIGKLSIVLLNMLDGGQDGFDEKTIKLINMYLGDLLWWISSTASDIGSSLDDIALFNIQKLNVVKNNKIEKEEETVTTIKL